MGKLFFVVFFSISLCLHGYDVFIKLHTGPFLRPGDLLHAEAVVNWTRQGGTPDVPWVVHWLKDGRQVCLSNHTFAWPARIRCTGFDLRVLRLTDKDAGEYRVVIPGGESPCVTVYIRPQITPQPAVPTDRNNPSTIPPITTVSDSGKNDPSSNPPTTWQATVKKDSDPTIWQTTVSDQTHVIHEAPPSSAGSCFMSMSAAVALVMFLIV